MNTTNVKSVMVGVILFMIGYMLGAVIDYIFMMLVQMATSTYSKILLVILQIFVLVAAIRLLFSFSGYKNISEDDKYFVRFSLISSQLFLFRKSINYIFPRVI